MTPDPSLPPYPTIPPSPSASSSAWGEPPPPDHLTLQGRAAHPAGRTRRRFGAAALGATLVAGGGAGALGAALAVGGTTTVVRTVAARTTASAGSAASASAAGSAQAIIAKLEPALVDIHTTGTSSSLSAFGNGLNPFDGGQTTTAAAGTGMIIRADGLILTNAHVLAGSTAITVTFDGSSSSHPATLVGEDAAKDIALIEVSGFSGLPTVTLANSSAVHTGDPVLAIGNALDLKDGGFTASSGIVSGDARSITTDNGENLTDLIQTDAAISSGDSGGALVDAAGEVIGMNTASAGSSSTNTASNIGFAIPASSITSELAQLEKGNIGTPTSGVDG